jgi:lipopolysaccharide cholinephosphotransferase
MSLEKKDQDNKKIGFKERQKISLNILMKIDSFCKKNEIKYYIAYGTLLGAVRHKGFIPWDDDIDLIMFRGDYERFINSFNIDSMNHKLKCISFEKGSFYMPFSKVVDTTTHVNQKDFLPLESNGVAVDIFPFDSVSNDYKICQQKKQQFRLFGKLLRYSLYNNKKEISNSFSIKHIAYFFSKTIGHKRIRKWILNKRFFESAENKKYCISYGAFLCGDPGVYEIDWFNPPIYFEFEGKQFPGIPNYDSFLKTRYGDYMKLPPKEQQIQHNIDAYYIE